MLAVISTEASELIPSGSAGSAVCGCVMVAT